MSNISRQIKASAHHAFMRLGGINNRNFSDAKKLATGYFIKEYGRELSFKENNDIDEELSRLIISEK